MLRKSKTRRTFWASRWILAARTSSRDSDLMAPMASECTRRSSRALKRCSCSDTLRLSGGSDRGSRHSTPGKGGLGGVILSLHSLYMCISGTESVSWRRSIGNLCPEKLKPPQCNISIDMVHCVHLHPQAPPGTDGSVRACTKGVVRKGSSRNGPGVDRGVALCPIAYDEQGDLKDSGDGEKRCTPDEA